MPLSKIYYEKWNEAIEVSRKLIQEAPEDNTWRASDDMRSIEEIIQHNLKAPYQIIRAFIDKDFITPELVEKAESRTFLDALQLNSDLVTGVFDALTNEDLEKVAFEHDGKEYVIGSGVWAIIDHERWHQAQLKMSYKLRNAQLIDA